MPKNDLFFEEIPALNLTHAMDLPEAIETLGYMPAAFKNLAALTSWSKSHGMRLEKLLDPPLGGTRFLHSASLSAPSLTQIWMKASKRNYRRDAIKALSEIDDETYSLHEYDVDHAVARGRLLKAWPDAWICMQFCDSGINRAVGSKIEKKISYQSTMNTDRIDFGAAQLLKLASPTMQLRGKLAIYQTLQNTENAFRAWRINPERLRMWISDIRAELQRLGL